MGYDLYSCPDMRWIAKHCVVARPFAVDVRDDVIEITWVPGDTTPPPIAAWSQAERLSQLLQAALASDATMIVVDLHDAGDANTVLLAVLVEARSHARRARVELVLRGSPALLQLAEICRLEAVLSLD